MIGFVGTVVSILANFLLFVVFLNWIHARCEALSASTCVAYAATLVLALITVLSQFLGLAGVLQPQFLLAAALCLSLIIWFATPSDGRSLTALRRVSSDVSSLPRWQVAVVAGYVAGFGYWLITFGVFDLSTNWDTLDYHLTFVDQYRRQGHLFDFSVNKWFFPCGGELITHWFSIGQPTAVLSSVGGCFAALLTMAASLALLRTLGCPSHVALLATGCTLLNSIVFMHLITCKNDLLCTGLLLVAVLSGLRLLESGHLVDRALFSIAAGSAIGVKYYCVGYVFVVLSALIAASIVRGEARKGLHLIGAALLGSFVMAGVWYIRNLWFTGAPMYPSGLFAIQTPGDLVRSNLFGTSMIGSHAENRLIDWASAVQQLWGPVFWIACLGAVPLLVAGTASHGGHGLRRFCNWRSLVAGSIVMGWLAVYFSTPFVVGMDRQDAGFLIGSFVGVRLGTPFLTLTTLLGSAIVLQRLSLWLPPAGRRIATAGLLFYFAQTTLDYHSHYVGLGFTPDWLHYVSTPRWMGSGIVSGAALGLCVFFFFHPAGQVRRIAMAGCFGLTIAWGIAATVASERFETHFAATYDRVLETQLISAIDKSDKLRSLRDSDVWICVVSSRSWPFGGARSQRRISSAHGVCSIPQRFRDAEHLEAFLREYPFSHLVVDKRQSEDIAVFDVCQRQRGDWFRLLASDRFYQVFELDRGQMKASEGTAVPRLLTGGEST